MAEMEVQAALLKAEDGAERAKKDEAGMPAGSPGWFLPARSAEIRASADLCSLAYPQLLRGVDHDDSREQVCCLGQPVQHDFLA